MLKYFYAMLVILNKKRDNLVIAEFNKYIIISNIFKQGELFMSKKIVLALLLISTLFLLTGCYNSETTFIIDENGNTNIQFMAQADEIMAGDEMNVAMWGLINSFPELEQNYEITQRVETKNYSDYLIYEFESLGNYDINSMENIEFTEDSGSYNFEMEIPSLVSEANEDNKNDVMFTINIELPAEIDMANTSSYEGNEVSWKITRENLVKGVRLRAFTK